MDPETIAMLSWMQVIASLALLFLALSLETGRRTAIPLLLRPAIIVSSTVIVSSSAAFTLLGEDYSSYLSLWGCQFAGVFCGLIYSRLVFNSPRSGEFVSVDAGTVRKLGLFIFLAGVLSALIFFAWMGVPILQGDIEQGRVDAAVEGTGYLRLMAYLTIPGALLMLAVSGRGGVKYAIVSTFIIFGMANRSPLLYLFIPALYIYIAFARQKLSSWKIVSISVVIGTLIVGIGTYRIFSQTEFANYSEYQEDIRDSDVLGVATTSLIHYAKVVADNAVLTKLLVDYNRIDYKFGASYFLLFITALPGEQLSLDREIKLASSKTFVGGGTPPTLMGEGYVNFSYPGTVLAGLFITVLLEFWFRQTRLAAQSPHPRDRGVANAIYGFMACWVILSQVAGLAGASTFPLACAIALSIVWCLSARRRYVE